MHTIKLNVGDNIYTHLMSILQNLKTDEIEIVEDIKKDTEVTLFTIDLSEYKIEAFKSIQDPLQWQQELRSEWN